jgi:hypothetical protein
VADGMPPQSRCDRETCPCYTRPAEEVELGDIPGCRLAPLLEAAWAKVEAQWTAPPPLPAPPTDEPPF